MQRNLDTRGRRREYGVMMIVILVALVALIASASLAIDVGMVWAARTQAQNAADSAALAAAASLIDPAVPAVTLPAAEAQALAHGAANQAISTPQVTINPADLTFGDWDLTNRVLDTGVDLGDPNQVTAVEVIARLDNVANGPVPAVMARVLGRDSFNVRADATAYLGFSGGVEAEALALPIVIDCCKLKGPECANDYCQTIQDSPVNPCPLDDPQTGDGDVTCLEFHSTPEQNACWTQFSPDNPSINTPGMTDIIQSGNEYPVSTSIPIHVDNGTKTPVLSDIYDRFHGEGYYSGGDPPGGIDRYPPIHTPPIADSWVVPLPVVECQDGLNCAGGDPMKVVGLVCFEIREVLVTPEKIIKGRFLCPALDADLMENCDLGGDSGGLDLGIRADRPVLVR